MQICVCITQDCLFKLIFAVLKNKPRYSIVNTKNPKPYVAPFKQLSYITLSRADLHPPVSAMETFIAMLNYFLFCKLMEALGQIKGADGTTSAAHSLDLLYDLDWAGFSAQNVHLSQPHRAN